jgi:glutathione S-transferase
MKVELYQFPFSHFCEKTRWALDYKGVAYRAVNLLPGFHVLSVRRLAPQTSVPVLRDGSAIIQGSAAIFDYLDAKYPSPPLTPSGPKTAAGALDWERFLDDEIGVTLRAFFYHHALRDRRLALGFLLQDAPWHKRAGFSLAFPAVRLAMASSMNLNASTALQARERLCTAFDRLDGALAGHSFLAGDGFSRADLTACALLSPFCLPGDSEASARFPAAVLELRNETKGRPFFRWVRSIYDSHRQPAPADTRCP